MNYQNANMKKPIPKINPSTVPNDGKGPLDLFGVDEGFLKGTMFRGLYNTYKNHQPRTVIPTDARLRALFDVDKYYFALHEMRLYLDNFPEDIEAINKFSEFQKGYSTAKRSYEERFGALDIEAPNLNTAPWNWTVGQWPLKGGTN